MLEKKTPRKEQMNHHINQPRAVIQSTNDQASIIMFWTNYAKICFSGEFCTAGKGGRKENTPEARLMNSVTISKDQVEHRLS